MSRLKKEGQDREVYPALGVRTMDGRQGALTAQAVIVRPDTGQSRVQRSYGYRELPNSCPGPQASVPFRTETHVLERMHGV